MKDDHPLFEGNRELIKQYREANRVMLLRNNQMFRQMHAERVESDPDWDGWA